MPMGIKIYDSSYLDTEFLKKELSPLVPDYV